MLQTTVADLIAHPRGPIALQMGTALVDLWTGVAWPGLALAGPELLELRRSLNAIRGISGAPVVGHRVRHPLLQTAWFGVSRSANADERVALITMCQQFPNSPGVTALHQALLLLPPSPIVVRKRLPSKYTLNIYCDFQLRPFLISCLCLCAGLWSVPVVGPRTSN